MNKQIYSTDRVLIHYDISENFQPKGAIVFLHGMGGSLTAFNPLRRLLEKEGYSTIAIDIRGQGKSGRPTKKNTYTLEHLASDVIEVIHAENIDKFILIGHCFGGIVAMAVTQKIQERIKKLILIDTNFEAPAWAKTLSKIPGFHFLMNLFIMLMPKWYIDETIDYQKFSGGGDYNIPRIISDISHTSLKTYLLLSKTLLTLDMSTVLKSFTLPVLIIQGEKDTIYPPNVAEKLHEYLPTSELVYVQKANHILVITLYKQIHAIISAHIKK